MSNPPPPAAPQQVQPLMYSTPQPARPGIITAIGVMSIVVASISGLASLTMGFWLLGLFFASQAMQTMAAGTTTTTTTDYSSSTVTVQAIHPRGLTAEQRHVVLEGFNQVRPLSDLRRTHLDALLATSGRDLLLIPPEQLTADLARRSISDSGTTGAAGDVEYFVLGAGRIELNDTEAHYIPLNGGRTITASADGAPESPVYTPEQIDAVVARVQSELEPLDADQPAPLTPEQIHALRTAVNSPDARLFDPFGRQEPADQVLSSILMHDGSIWVITNEGSISIQPDGQVTSGAAMMGAFGFFNISTTALAIGAFEAAGSIALAVYLLVIGILVLRQHPSGGRLHSIYAVLKLPLAILAGLTWAWIIMGFMSGAPFGAAAVAPALIVGGVVGVLSAAYPVGLLIALRTQSVRAYYRTARQ